MKNPVLSLFDNIHLNEGGTLTQMWITNSNLHHLMKISLRGVQEELIYFICQNILGRGKGKGRIEQKR